MADSGSGKKDPKSNLIKKGINALKGKSDEPRYKCPICNNTHKMEKFSCNPRCCDVYCLECLKKHCKSLVGKAQECDCPMKAITGCIHKLTLPGNIENLQVLVSSHEPSMENLQKNYLKKGKRSGSAKDAKDDYKSSEHGSNSTLDQPNEPSKEQLPSAGADTRKLEDTTSIVRPALGRNATIGYLYDAKTDKLSEDSILLEEKEDQLKAQRKDVNQSWKVELITEENVFDRMSKLEVCPETQLSILSGQLEPRGHAEYLNCREWDVEGENKVHGAFICTLMLQAIDIPQDALAQWMPLRENTDLDEATHVVVGVDYGLCIVVSVTKYLHKEIAPDDKIDFEAALKTVTETWNLQSLNQIESKNLSFAAQNLQDCKINFYSDMNFDNLDKIKTMNGAVEFLKKLSGKNVVSDSGIIVPIRYRLLSVSRMADILNVNIVHKNFQQAANSTDAVTKFLELMDSTEGMLIKLKRFLENVTSNEEYVSDEALKTVQKGRHYAEAIEQFKKRLQTSLKNIRSGIVSADGILSDYKIILETSKFYEDVREFMSTMNGIKKALLFVSKLRDLEVILVKKSESMSDVREEEDLTEYCVFFYSYKETAEFMKNEELFLSLLKRKNIFKHKAKSPFSKLRFVAADIDCCKEQLGHLGRCTQVCYFSEGCSISDILNKIEKDKNTAVAKPDGALKELKSTPTTFAYVKLPCPGSTRGSCSKDLIYWQCSECCSLLEYDFGNKSVYCACGQGELNDFSYRCNSQMHVDNFIRFESNMEVYLKKMEPIKCTNILLLGETGVGKSTWINAFINYGTFQSLDEASASDLIAQIPTRFTMSINRKMTPIEIDSSSNENFASGQSATQKPMAYRVLFEDNHVRLIDTPGMGDTRGIEQDKRNMEATMNFLSQFDDLHAVCILMKSNDCKLTVSFTFCINQILTHLHKDASQNIIFCLTNSRGTQFEPGETWDLLKAYLEEIEKNYQAQIELTNNRTVYCFDSEPFRYLCALTKEATFRKAEIKDYFNSWDRSVESTKQLLNYVYERIPHRLHDTVSLSNARNLIDKLTEPMVDIGVNIEKNRKGVLDQRKIMETLTVESQDLKDKLKIKMVEYMAEPLEQPRMVCASRKCRRIVQSKDTDQKIFIYEQVCHEPCWLDGVEVNSYPNKLLQKCAVIGDKGLCKICSCRWQEHLHVTYTYKEIIKENSDLEGQLHATTDERASIQAAVAQCDTTIDELESELKLIAEYAAKFAHFLKTNSILPYNDSFDDYMEHLMKNDKFKFDEKQMESLKKVRVMYKKQIELLKDAFADTGSVNVDDVHKYKVKLIEQKHTGAQLKQILDVANEAAEKHAALKDKMCRPGAKVTKTVNKKKKEVLDSLQQLLECEVTDD